VVADAAMLLSGHGLAGGRIYRRMAGMTCPSVTRQFMGRVLGFAKAG
jgi:hypothetical protein